MKKIVVLYHMDCPDGFGAAWVAWKKFGNKAEYIAVPPRVLPKTKLQSREIYVLDNSYSVEIMRKLARDKNRVVVIDHHGSSEDDVKSSPEHVFDLNHSGAVLAWKYFFPQKKLPRLLAYIEDNDLWRHELPNTNEVQAFLSAYEYDFKIWSKLADTLETRGGIKKSAEQGVIVLKYQEKLVRDAVRKAELVLFHGKKTLAANSPSKSLASGIGHEIAKQFKFGIIWYETNGDIRVSLRSIGNFDVAKLAQKYGEGGGHKNAAGFTIKAIGKFPWKRIIS
ncbi:MAG: DHHA1 domain-containing protein [Candidatus Jorgensenbacteria bacterium]|nr:DHHA1 domain-containing protein [Candidatus Jorgensenbacteria bacterium]